MMFHIIFTISGFRSLINNHAVYKAMHMQCSAETFFRTSSVKFQDFLQEFSASGWIVGTFQSLNNGNINLGTFRIFQHLSEGNPACSRQLHIDNKKVNKLLAQMAVYDIYGIVTSPTKMQIN